MTKRKLFEQYLGREVIILRTAAGTIVDLELKLEYSENDRFKVKSVSDDLLTTVSKELEHREVHFSLSDIYKILGKITASYY